MRSSSDVINPPCGDAGWQWCTIKGQKLDFHMLLGQRFFAIKDRNGMDLTEAEDIKKRWQEYTEELYKKIFMTQINRRV